MIPFDELNTQNHNIAELSKVLSRLIDDREMVDTDICCELFDRYTTKVRDHHEFNNQHIYTVLLSHADRQVNGTANRFLEGEREIKKLFKSYTNKWCKHGLQVYNHDQFLAETREMFELVWDRIQDESEQLYPLARKIEGGELRMSA